MEYGALSFRDRRQSRINIKYLGLYSSVITQKTKYKHNVLSCILGINT